MNQNDAIVLVVTTVASESDAQTLAKTLVQQSLAACVQVSGPITSHYRWAGESEQATEYRLMIKTADATWPNLKERLMKLHPYDQPQIVKLDIDDATDGYREWVIDQST